MQKFAWVGKVKDGKADEYKRRHDEIWPEMVEVLKNAGIKNYSIWLTGDTLFGYYECDDIDFATKYQADSPVVQKWNVYMDDVLELVRDPKTGMQPKLAQMFNLD